MKTNGSPDDSAILAEAAINADDAQAAAEEAARTASAARRQLQQAESHRQETAAELAAATAARDAGKRELGLARGARTRAKKALEAAEKELEDLCATANPPKGKVTELKKLVEDAEAALAAARRKVRGLEDEQAVLDVEADSAEAENAGAELAHAEAKAAHGDAADSARTARREALKAAAAAWRIFSEHGAVAVPPGRAEKLDPEWREVLGRRSRNADQKLLRIRTSSRAVDPLATEAMRQLRAESRKAEAAVRNTIRREGLGTEVLEVTRHLSGRSMSEARRRVLAESYALTLKSLFADPHSVPAASYPQAAQATQATQATRVAPRRRLQKEVADTKGFSDAVVFEQERFPDPQVEDDLGGPLYRFADTLVGLVIEDSQLDLSPELRERLVHQVRANL